MRKEKKTNVMRILDKAKIPYTARSYEYEESNLSGTHAAAALGYDPAMVFKTIVTKGDKTGPVVFCLPSTKELDLKAAARISKKETHRHSRWFFLCGPRAYLTSGASTRLRPVHLHPTSCYP